MVAVIGDASLAGGMAMEAINQAGHLKTRLIVLLNDNEMSIAPAVGALTGYLNRLKEAQGYHRFKDDVGDALTTTGNALADAAGWTADKAEDVGGKTKEGVKTVGEKTAQGAKTVGEKTAEGAKTVGEKTAEGAKKTGKAIKKAITP